MRFRVPMSAAILAALPSVAAAQFPPPPGASAQSQAPAQSQPAQSQVQDRWPEMPPPSSSRGGSSQQQQQKTEQQQKPAAAARAPAPQMVKPSDLDVDAPSAPAAAAAPKPKMAAAPATAIACSGVFAKDSTHLKLAVKYDSRNIVYTDVDGPDGSKIKASVLYPNDPKRRLEAVSYTHLTLPTILRV